MKRQDAVLEADDEHDREFQPLGGVQRQQRDAVGARIEEVRLARERDGVEEARADRRRRSRQARSGAAAPRRIARSSSGACAVSDVGRSRAAVPPARSSARRAVRRARSSARDGRHRPRARPCACFLNGMPERASASTQRRRLRVGAVEHGEIGERQVCARAPSRARCRARRSCAPPIMRSIVVHDELGLGALGRRRMDRDALVHVAHDLGDRRARS